MKKLFRHKAIKSKDLIRKSLQERGASLALHERSFMFEYRYYVPDSVLSQSDLGPGPAAAIKLNIKVNAVQDENSIK